MLLGNKPSKQSKKKGPVFDLTVELQRLAKHLMKEAGIVRPHRAASEAEAFSMLHEATGRLMYDAALTRGLELAEDRMSVYAVDNKKQAALVCDLRELLRGMIKSRRKYP